MKTGKTLFARALDMIGLVVVFGVFWIASTFAPSTNLLAGGDAALIAALGFLLIGGTLLSELVAIVKLPHLTGYLAAGILAGPHVLHFIDHQTVDRLTPVNTLALSLIALAGGTELKMETLKKSVRTLAYAMAIQTPLVLAVMIAVFFLAAPFIGFTSNQPMKFVIGVAILWGVLAVSRSPSATLGILQQTHANGKLAQYTLAFVMASDVVVVVVLASAITVVRPLLDPNLPFSTAAFSNLGHEILGSVAIGTTLGLILIVYLRLIGRQLLVVLVAIGFGATETLRYLHFDPLLTFMVAGFVVQNLSKQGEKLMHAIDQAGTVVYVVFFASAGAHLNVPLLRSLWPIAFLLAGTRAIATFVAAKIANRLANDDAVIRKWAWAPLISQAGFSIGIAQLAAREFAAGRAFADLAIATIALNEMVGPILFKVALDDAGETRAPGAPIADTEEQQPPSTAST